VFNVLAIILVLGSKAPRSAGFSGSAQAQHGRFPVFPVARQASGKNSVGSIQDLFTKQINDQRVFGATELPEV
jgi:hypothetical protein